MPATFIGSATGTNTATMPSHQTGDLILVAAFRIGSSTAPSLPAGFTDVLSGGNATAPAISIRIGYKIAASGSETVGTWTNATSLEVHVFRGQSPSPIGDSARTFGTTSNISYASLTLVDSSGNSIVAAFGVANSTTSTVENPPTGMTLRTSGIVGTEEVAGFDTNGGVTSWTSKNVALGASMRSVGAVVEIKAPPSVTISASVTTTSTLLKAAGHTVSAAAAASVAILKARGQTISAAVSSAASLVQQGRKVIAVSSSAAATLAKSIGKRVAVLSAAVTVATKSVAKSVSIAVTGGIVIGALKVKTQIISAVASSSVGIFRAIGKSVSVYGSIAITIRKAISKTLAIASTSATSIAYVRTLLLIVTVAASTTVSVTRSIGKQFAVSADVVVAILTGAIKSWIALKRYVSGSWIVNRLKMYQSGVWVKPTLKRYIGGVWTDVTD